MRAGFSELFSKALVTWLTVMGGWTLSQYTVGSHELIFVIPPAIASFACLTVFVFSIKEN